MAGLRPVVARYVDYGSGAGAGARPEGRPGLDREEHLPHRPGARVLPAAGRAAHDPGLPPDEPFREDRCGSCRRCIEACPTDAIRGPRELDGGEFEARYGDTPYERPGREGLLRNLCVGLGNSGSEEAAGGLLRAVEEGAELVAEHAAWASGGWATGRRPKGPVTHLLYVTD